MNLRERKGKERTNLNGIWSISSNTGKDKTDFSRCEERSQTGERRGKSGLAVYAVLSIIFKGEATVVRRRACEHLLDQLQVRMPIVPSLDIGASWWTFSV
jgi:hypothetical protein